MATPVSASQPLPDPTPAERSLRSGCTGDDVRAIQDVLNFHLRGLMPLLVDGIFGDRTESRIQFFQRVNGLAEDGVVGPTTRAALFETTVASFRMLFIPRALLNPQPAPATAPQPQAITLPAAHPLPQRLAAPTPALPSRLQLLTGSRDLRRMPALALSPHFGPQVTIPESRKMRLPILPALASPTSAAPAITPSVLKFRLTVPTRKDPTDPQVRLRREAIELIDAASIDTTARGYLIDQVPDPEEETKVQASCGDFKWGADPVFIPPYSTTTTTGRARFTIKLTGGPTTHPQLLVSAWGEGRATIHLADKEFETQTLPRAQLESVGMAGVAAPF